MRWMDLGRVDLNLLVPLDALLEERHVSRAAQRCHLSQPAMSRTLGRLRTLFDDELLIRSSSGYELTLRAEQLRRDLASLGARLEALLAGQEFDPVNAAEFFRLVGTDVTTQLFAPVLNRLVRARAPKSRLTFLPWHSDVDDDLYRGTADLAFRAVRPPDPLRSELLLRQRFVVVVSAEHPLAGRASLALDTYLAQAHVSVDLADGRQPSIDDRLAAAGHRRDVAVSVPYHSVAVDVVDGTDLIATVPHSFTAGVDAAKYHVLRAPREIEAVDWMMIWHPRTEHDHTHRWLRSLVREAARIVDPGRRSRRS